MTEEQKKEMMKKVLQCKVCGKQMPVFYRGCVRTTYYHPERTRTIFVCNDECKDKWESQYFVEEYKGSKIYCIDGRYIPYFGAAYYFETLEDCKKRIGQPNIAHAPFYSYQ